MRRVLVALVVGGGVFAVSYAAAASLSVGASSIAAGFASTPCTTGGISITQLNSGTAVTSVSLANVPADCAGGSVLVTVSNGTTSASNTATVTVPTGGGTLSVALPAVVPATQSNFTSLVIQGP